MARAKEKSKNKKNPSVDGVKDITPSQPEAKTEGEKIYMRPLFIVLGALFGAAVLAWIIFGLLIGNAMSALSIVQTILPTKEKAEVLPTNTNERYLDGVKVNDAAHENQIPIAVMIENLASADVRPQWGMSEASVIYETIAEGGITRFLVVFLETTAEQIGPVRSARPYYVDFAEENDAVYVNAGGSPEGLAAISGLGTKNINALTAGRFFWRGEGSAPHNLFTSWELLMIALRDNGLEEYEPSFERWTFEDDPPLESLPKNEDAQTLTVDWTSGTRYDARFVYDRGTNSYKRFHGDEPHIDRNTDEQLAAKNVLVQQIPAEGYYPSGKGRVILNITGEGSGYVAKNGTIIPATWKKAERTSRLRFYDETGAEIPLQRGSTWVEVVPGDRSILAE